MYTEQDVRESTKDEIHLFCGSSILLALFYTLKWCMEISHKLEKLWI